MSVWDMRQYMEQNTPWWVPFAAMLIVGLACTVFHIRDLLDEGEEDDDNS